MGNGEVGRDSVSSALKNTHNYRKGKNETGRERWNGQQNK